MANWDVATAGAAFEFETTLMGYPSKPIAIDTNHFFVSYQGASSDGFASVFTVNTSTWAVTEQSTIEHDTQNQSWTSTVQIDTNHFITFYLGSATTTDGFAQVMTVDTTTWAITTSSSRFLFDTDVGSYNSAQKIDANHFINFWAGSGADGYVQVFTVDTTTWAVTTANSSLEFDTSNGTYNTSWKIDDNHFINFWSGSGSDGYVQVFTVNTSTWAVTTANSNLEFDTQNAIWQSCYKVDTNHFINFWSDVDSDGKCQVFTVNTSTWAVTTANSVFEFETQQYLTNSQYSITQIDSNHFLHAWAGVDTDAGTAYDGFAQIFEVNTSTWAVTTSGASFEFDTTQGEYNAISELIAGTYNKYLLVWSGSGDDGYAQVLKIQRSPTVSLSSPSDGGSTSDTTPDLTFTGTDADNDDIRYNVHLTSLSVDATSNSGEGISVSSDTWSHTCSGSNRILVVGVNARGLVSNTNTTVTGVTYNGVALTKIRHDSVDSGDTMRGRTELWYLIAPATGANNIVVTWTGTVDFECCGAISLTGAIQSSSAIDANNGQSANTDTTPSTDVTVVAQGCYVIDSIYSRSETSFANNSDQTNIFNVLVNSAGDGTGMSYKIATATGATTMGWTTGPEETTLSAVSIAPIGGIHAVSGTDAGFSGTPDNTDPFASAQAVTYTVQSALSTTTYYWRVRGIDPSGSNAYGAWSSTRSFTVSTSSIKTVNSLAKASVKTINGLAIASVKTFNSLA
jgi:hypothetical protein